jgi:charged multivesicular body protein 3
MEEMLEDTLDMEEDEELEDEADAEVDKVLFELTNGKLGEAGSVDKSLPVSIVIISPSRDAHLLAVITR